MQWASAFTPETREGVQQISQLVRVLSDMTDEVLWKAWL